MTTSSPHSTPHPHSNIRFSLSFESWMDLLDQDSLSDQDRDLFFQGLQVHRHGRIALTSRVKHL